MSKQKAQYLIKTRSNLLFGHSLPLFSIKPKKIIMLTGNWKLFSVQVYVLSNQFKQYFFQLQGLFQQLIMCDNRTESPALFQNIFKCCTFLPTFSNVLPYFALFKYLLALFLLFFLKIARMLLPYYLEQALSYVPPQI